MTACPEMSNDKRSFKEDTRFCYDSDVYSLVYARFLIIEASLADDIVFARIAKMLPTDLMQLDQHSENSDKSRIILLTIFIFLSI